MKKIKLSKGKYTLVDDSDFETVNKYKWYYVYKERSRNGYAVRDFGSKNNKFGVSHVTLHRFLMEPPKDMLVDHVNGDGLDNRRGNLRVCTPTQNNGNFHMGVRNKSGYKGVSWHKATGRWRATLLYMGKQRYGGLFDNKLHAAEKYNEMAKKYFGEFARLNDV